MVCRIERTPTRTTSMFDAVFRLDAAYVLYSPHRNTFWNEGGMTSWERQSLTYAHPFTTRKAAEDQIGKRGMRDRELKWVVLAINTPFDFKVSEWDLRTEFKLDVAGIRTDSDVQKISKVCVG